MATSTVKKQANPKIINIENITLAAGEAKRFPTGVTGYNRIVIPFQSGYNTSNQLNIAFGAMMVNGEINITAVNTGSSGTTFSMSCFVL